MLCPHVGAVAVVVQHSQAAFSGAGVSAFFPRFRKYSTPGPANADVAKLLATNMTTSRPKQRPRGELELVFMIWYGLNSSPAHMADLCWVKRGRLPSPLAQFLRNLGRFLLPASGPPSGAPRPRHDIHAGGKQKAERASCAYRLGL